MTTIPVINVAMPWWFRGVYIGAFLNLSIALVAYVTLGLLMLSVFGVDGLIASPFWVVLEGAIFGFIIDYLATKYAGEGIAVHE